MSGPFAFVVLWETLTDPDHHVLRRLIDSVEGGEPGSPPTPIDQFWVEDTRPIGGRYSGGRHPFSLSLHEPLWDWGDHSLDGYAKAFGCAPVGELALAASCNGDEDHQILGELCLHLAEELGDVIDFGGALLPPILREADIGPLRADWARIEPHFREMVAGMPGQVVGLPHATADGRNWVTHVGDAAFLRAWLEHPNFRMTE